MTWSVTAPQSASTAPSRDLDLQVDFLEYWVADLSAVGETLRRGFGFDVVDSFVDPSADGEVVCLTCGGVDLVLRCPGAPHGIVARQVGLHGDTVGDLALVCADPARVADRAVAAGLAVSASSDAVSIDVSGQGTMRHTVRPARQAPPRASARGEVPMQAIDHVAFCVPYGAGDELARMYGDVFALDRMDVGDCEEISTPGGGMRSIVLRARSGFSVVLTEPSQPGGSGQTQQFLDAHGGPGLQHAAISYGDIVAAVTALRARGVEFLAIPDGYYVTARQRLPHSDLPWDALRDLGILVDAEDDGLLFQLFTRPVSDPGTFFFELIQRCGATGFGANNVRALFEAVEAALVGSGKDS